MNLIMVNDSLLLNNVVLDKISQRNDSSSLMTPYMEFLFDLDHFRFSGFLIVIDNKMRITGESCHLFDKLFSLELSGRWTGIACSHYLVRYEPAPLHVRMMSPVFSNLFARHLLTMMLTVVRFSCPPEHESLRQCPNHPLCIPDKLFCDTMDNCGMGSDELWCPVPAIIQQQSAAPLHEIEANSTHGQPQQQQLSMFMLFATANSSPTSLFILLLLGIIIAGVLLLLTGITIQKRKQRWASRCQQEAPTVRAMFMNAMPFNAGGGSTVGRKASHFATAATDDSGGGGETLALLTLGLKNVLHSLPDHYDDDDQQRHRNYYTDQNKYRITDYGAIMETEEEEENDGKMQEIHFHQQKHHNENGIVIGEQKEVNVGQQQQRRVHWPSSEEAMNVMD